MIINAIIEKDKDGYFAFVPELKGCVNQGNSFEEAKANIKEAIELYYGKYRERRFKFIIVKRLCDSSNRGFA